MRRRSEPGSPSIWPRPYVWVWLVVNLVWLQLVVPSWIISNNVAVLDPEAATGQKLMAGFVAIVAIPFVGVLGFALLTLALFSWADRLLMPRR